MIITVTPNPSIDRTQSLAGPLTVGGVNRVRAGTDQAGGKGVNVATVVHHAGEQTLSVVPTPDSGTFARLVTAGGVPTRFTGDAAARVNLTLTDTDGVTTKVNSPGPDGTDGTGFAAAVDAVTAEVTDGAADGTWLVLAGSLPPGYPDDWYATVTAAARRRGLRVAVDTSDAPLAALVTAAVRDPAAVPDLIKPNSHELAQIVAATGGTSPDGDALEAAAAAGDLTGVATAAADLTDRGFGAVLVSLGAAGALLAEQGPGDSDGSAGTAWYCTGPKVEVVSTVGAGDSTLAGYVLGAVRGLGAADRLALAVAHGTTAVTLPGTTLPTPADLPTTLPVPVRTPDPLEN